MHYAEFAEDEVSSFVRLSARFCSTVNLLTVGQSAALLQAIKDYENNKWKAIGARVGKPAKVRMIVPRISVPLHRDGGVRLKSVSPRLLTNNRRVSSSQRSKVGKCNLSILSSAEETGAKRGRRRDVTLDTHSLREHGFAPCTFKMETCLLARSSGVRNMQVSTMAGLQR